MRFYGGRLLIGGVSQVHVISKVSASGGGTHLLEDFGYEKKKVIGLRNSRTCSYFNDSENLQLCTEYLFLTALCSSGILSAECPANADCALESPLDF